MTDAQFDKFINVLATLKDHDPYTLSQASDWPMLMAVGGMLVLLLIYIWQDLRMGFKEHKIEGERELMAEATERKAQDQMIWDYVRDCQADCCPRGKHDPMAIGGPHG